VPQAWYRRDLTLITAGHLAAVPAADVALSLRVIRENVVPRLCCRVVPEPALGIVLLRGRVCRGGRERIGRGV
jgi:hypothetical protein